jgi:hypothetical protein
VLSRGEACENTRKTRLSIKTERYLVVFLLHCTGKLYRYSTVVERFFC